MNIPIVHGKTSVGRSCFSGANPWKHSLPMTTARMTGDQVTFSGGAGYRVIKQDYIARQGFVAPEATEQDGTITFKWPPFYTVTLGEDGYTVGDLPGAAPEPLVAQTETGFAITIDNVTYMLNREEKTLRILIHDSPLFRNAAFFKDLRTYILDKYQDSGAQIVDFGCGTGESTYSLLIALLNGVENRIERLDRFLPLHGTDPGHLAIDTANRFHHLNNIGAFGYSAQQALGEDAQFTDYMDPVADMVWQPKKPIRDAVKFSVGDILDYAGSQDSGRPTVVVFNNAWYHLTDEEGERLASNLFSHLPARSIVVGGVDDAPYAPTQKLLSAAGFKPVEYKSLTGMLFLKP